MVYTKTIDIKKKENGSYTISVAISDNSLIIKTVNKQDLQNLLFQIESLINE
jgi:UDP-N-acetylglucosamine enolpyruvyl transferase